MGWSLADFELKNPIVLCGGMMNEELILKAVQMGVGSITLGTYSSNLLSKHPKPWLYRIPSTNCFINSYGIRHTYLEREKFIRKAISEARKSKVLVICSYIERNPEDSLGAVKFFEDAGCDVLEINPTPLIMGCIGTEGSDLLKEDNLVRLVGDFIKTARESSLPISIKFPSTIIDVAGSWSFFKSKGAAIAHIMNAVVPAFVTNKGGRPYFKTPSGTGGMTGECIKPLSLARVRAVSLHGERNIIGTGGVMTQEDAEEYFLQGASAVGVHSLLYSSGLPGLKRLTEKVAEILRK